MPRVACSTAAFSRLPLPEALDAIKALGFAHVDLLTMGGWAHLAPAEVVRDPSQAERVASLFEERHLSAVAINARLSHDAATADPERQAANREELRALCELGRACGIPLLTLSPGRGEPGMPRAAAVEVLTRNLYEHATVARAAGLTLSIENHSDTLGERPEDALAILDAVPGLRLTYDPSHAVMKNLGDDLAPRLVERAFHCHLRDAVPGSFQAPLGQGRLDFDRVFAALRDSYRGEAVTVEYIDSHADYDVVPEVLKLRALLEAELE